MGLEAEEAEGRGGSEVGGSYCNNIIIRRRQHVPVTV